MLRSISVSGLLLLALATQGCDVGSASADDKPAIVDPSSLEIGDDTDLGAGDDFGPTPLELHGKLHVSGTELRDEHDQKIQLRGVSSMWLNWENDGYAENLEGLKWLRNNWHVNLIRAAMGIEAPGGYFDNPEKAKAQVEQIVENAISAGVYVLIDWHTENANMQTEQSVAFFSEMAAKYAGVPNVLYETFNEPTKQVWSTDLKPYHEAVVAAIRAADPDNQSVIVLGTPTWSQDVDKAAADPVAGNNLMYTLHFYACDHGGFLVSKAKYAISKGLPLFVTEWGATKADGGTQGEVCQEKAQTWMDFLNPLSISWAAWKFDNCKDSTCFLSADAPLNGGWTSQFLHGEGLFLRARLQEQP
ncbi:MAG TPA: glycoside hydrolase family 5 protein [Polyangiaceae bacterium]